MSSTVLLPWLHHNHVLHLTHRSDGTQLYNADAEFMVYANKSNQMREDLSRRLTANVFGSKILGMRDIGNGSSLATCSLAQWLIVSLYKIGNVVLNAIRCGECAEDSLR